MATREFGLAMRAHSISEALDIPFGAAWRVANCVSKARFQTREEAEGASAANRRAGRGATRAYRCDICGRWHLCSGKEER